MFVAGPSSGLVRAALVSGWVSFVILAAIVAAMILLMLVLGADSLRTDANMLGTVATFTLPLIPLVAVGVLLVLRGVGGTYSVPVGVIALLVNIGLLIIGSYFLGNTILDYAIIVPTVLLVLSLSVLVWESFSKTA